MMADGAIVNAGSLAWAKWLEAAYTERHGHYKVARDYYEGRHLVKVPDKARLWLERHYAFRGNLCDVVVDALAERLVITGFDNPDQATAAAAWNWFRLNRMDRDSRVIHKEAAKFGDFYVLVDWDPVRMIPRYTYQDPFTLFPCYVDRVIQHAVKVWDVDDSTRRYTVYYADRVEKYVSTRGRAMFGTGGWSIPVLEATEDWTDLNGQPLGVPVVHFRNNAQSDCHGRAEAQQVIPIQDLLNKTLVDLALVMDTMGFPQRWATGPTPFGHEWSVAPGRVWKSDDPDAKFGQFDAADPKGILDTLLFLVNFAAGRSRTPQHLFHIAGDYPTGEALKTAEAGFLGKLEDRAASFGTDWETLNHLAFRLDNTFGKGRWEANPVLDTLWRTLELRNEQAHAQAIASVAPLIPRVETWRKLGYTPADLVRLQTEWDAEKAQEADLGTQALAAFNQGN